MVDIQGDQGTFVVPNEVLIMAGDASLLVEWRFGGGGAADDSRTGGGGWVGGTSSVAAYSKNNGVNQSNSSGANSGHGYVTITRL